MFNNHFVTMKLNDYYWVVYPDKEERLFLTGNYEIKFLECEKKSWFINILYKKDTSFGDNHDIFLRILSDYIHTLNSILCIKKISTFEKNTYKKSLEFEDKKIIIDGPFKSIEEKSILLKKSKTNNNFVFGTNNILNEIKLYDPIEHLIAQGYDKTFSDNIYIFKIIDKNNKSLLTFGLYR